MAVGSAMNIKKITNTLDTQLNPKQEYSVLFFPSLIVKMFQSS